MYRNYTEKQLIEAVNNSLSYRQVMIKLNLRPSGGNYSTIKKNIKRLQLDISHFTHQLWSKGKKLPPKRPITDYLSNKQTIQTTSLRKRLLRENYFQHECCNCKNTIWLGNPIPLELHHIDGNNQNNNLTNLQLLCPNCHSLTNNYRGKNISTISHEIITSF